MKNLKDCIVSFLDLNGVKTALNEDSSEGVKLMTKFHRLVAVEAPSLKAHKEVCFWQDSVLLLAAVDSTKQSYQLVMDEVEKLKKKIDAMHRCHAVAVKGQHFPPIQCTQGSAQPRIIYLSASSLAFSNCFLVEAHLKTFRADWYIDSRIASRIATRKADHTEEVEVLPRKSKRPFMVYRGSFRPEIKRTA